VTPAVWTGGWTTGIVVPGTVWSGTGITVTGVVGCPNGWVGCGSGRKLVAGNGSIGIEELAVVPELDEVVDAGVVEAGVVETGVEAGVVEAGVVEAEVFERPEVVEGTGWPVCGSTGVGVLEPWYWATASPTQGDPNMEFAIARPRTWAVGAWRCATSGILDASVLTVVAAVVEASVEAAVAAVEAAVDAELFASETSCEN
jgi:hypothetical protein